MNPCLKEYDGLTWKEAERKLEHENILLAFDKNWAIRQIPFCQVSWSRGRSGYPLLGDVP